MTTGKETMLELFDHLRSLKINLWLEGEKLCYSSPSGALTDGLKKEIAANRDEIIAFLREAQAIYRAETLSEIGTRIQPSSRAGPIPLSFAQQRIWFFHNIQPGSPLYNAPLAFHISGQLDPDLLEQSIQILVRRHESLRTRFPVDAEGQPRQEILKSQPIPFSIVSLEHLPLNRRIQEARNTITMAACQPFDLEHGPLFRLLLVRLAAEEQILLFNMHHIISDGWSEGILFSEISAIYRSLFQHSPLKLPVLSIQYADFSIWQHQYMQGSQTDTDLAYWRGKLGGNLPVLQLPTSRTRPFAQTFQGAQVLFEISPVLLAALKSIGRQENATLFMTLLATFEILLHRYTGQTDLLIGSVIANRNHPDISRIIGFFVNTLVLRNEISSQWRFKDLLARVRETALEAYAHQDLPFEVLVENLQPKRDPSYSPFFQTMFVLEDASLASLDLPGLTVRPWPVDTSTAKFDLSLIVTETRSPENTAKASRKLSGLSCVFEYSTDLFDEQFIARLAQRWVRLLEALVADQNQLLKQIQLTDEIERRLVTIDWNQTYRDFPQHLCIHQIFEEHTSRNPDAMAITYLDPSNAHTEEISYGQLNQRANQLAHYLTTLGVTAESRVGIAIDRSIDLVVAMLAIIKAGATYVPLDFSFPPERLRFVLQDTGVMALLTHTRWKGSRLDSGISPAIAEQLASLKVIQFEDHQPQIQQQGLENPPPISNPEHLAYIMFTSGSAGNPKGIGIPHQAIARLVLNTNYITLSPGDRIAQVSNAAFDALTFEVWGALLNGAQLVGFPQETILSPKDFIASLRQHRIDSMFLTSSLFNQIAAIDPGAFSSLRDLLVGGEALSPHRIRQVLQSAPPRRLLNGYGPTENTTFTTTHLIRDVPEGITNIPIGRPIANTTAYILDDDLQPVPIDIPGELHAGGFGVAQGYVNHPELTAEKFVPDPFSNRSSAKLYKTGDLARYLPDGSIEYLGRIDQQVKIRGYRIELGEIESVLSQHPAIREAAVIVRQDRQGDKRILAYFTTWTAQIPKPAELRSFLQDKLPEYMVPSVYSCLVTIPLTPNGKIDQQALPDPARASTAEESFIAPRTPIETALVELWREVLGNQQIGIDDNFFITGGHSLLATRLLWRINQEMGIELPLRVLFDAPTIARLAEQIELLRKRSDPLLSSQSTQANPGHSIADREEIEL
jgi:amino acid adenylation domain-containing protein